MQRRALPQKQGDLSDAGKRRLLAVSGDPFLSARWERVVFLHFAIELDTLSPQIKAPFELELYDGDAVISVVAFTMRRFRPARLAAIIAWPFALISRQLFLNLRTYVRLGDEPGALFLWGVCRSRCPCHSLQACSGCRMSSAPFGTSTGTKQVLCGDL